MIIPRQLALLGAPCRFLGVAVQQRGGPSLGGFTGQALGMGRRVLLRGRGTQPGTLDGDCWDFRI